MRDPANSCQNMQCPCLNQPFEPCFEVSLSGLPIHAHRYIGFPRVFSAQRRIWIGVMACHGSGPMIGPDLDRLNTIQLTQSRGTVGVP